MHPARAKARQVQALTETAESVATLKAQMDRIEATLAEVLALLKPEPAAAPKPAPKPKDK